MGAEMLMGAPPDDDPNKMPDWVKQFAVAMVMGQTAPLYLIYAVGGVALSSVTSRVQLTGLK